MAAKRIITTLSSVRISSLIIGFLRASATIVISVWQLPGVHTFLVHSYLLNDPRSYFYSINLRLGASSTDVGTYKVEISAFNDTLGTPVRIICRARESLK